MCRCAPKSRYRRVGARRWTRIPMLETRDEPDRFTAALPSPRRPAGGSTPSAPGSTPLATWHDELRRKVEAGETELHGRAGRGRAARSAVELPDVDDRARRAGGGTDGEGIARAPVDGGGRARARCVRVLVRAVPAELRGPEGRRSTCATRRPGLRRRVPPADPPDRPHARKGPTTALDGRRPTTRAARGRSARPRAATPPCIPSSARSRTSTASSPRAREPASSSRSTSRSSARPTIRGSREHPEWFRTPARRHESSTPRTRRRSTRTSTRSTSTAEDWRACGRRWRDVVRFWIDARRARSSASTTRTPSRSPFWEWLIGECSEHPEVIFLAEAFTRPEVMERLAKLGFTQSYTYFTWRNTKRELDRVLHRARRRRADGVLPAERLAEHARHPQRAAAARRPRGVRTRASCSRRRCRRRYGIYGPAFELGENVAARSRVARSTSTPRSTRCAALGPERRRSLPLVARLNEIRREHPALQHIDRCASTVDNDELIAYAQGSRRLDAIDRVREPRPARTRTGSRRSRADARSRRRGVRGGRPAHRRTLPLAAGRNFVRARRPASAHVLRGR